MKNLLLLTSGLAIGAAAGILLAPKSGKKTREDIADEIESLKSKMKKFRGDARNSFEEKIEELKQTLAEMESQVNN